MFPFIIPIIREVVRYFQDDQNGCGGRGSNVPQGTGPAPATPEQDSSLLRDAVNFVRRLGPVIRRTAGPLRSPNAERMIREHVVPFVQEGSMFLPEHMPNLVGLSPAEMAIELGLCVALSPLGPVAGMPGRYLLRRGIQHYLESSQDGATAGQAASAAGHCAGVAVAASRQFITFHRAPGVCQEPAVLMCR